MPSNDLRNWDRFCLLIWKNFFIIWNNRRQMICLFLMPFLICIPIVIIRYHVNPRRVNEKRFENIDMNLAWKNLCDMIEQRRESFQLTKPDFVSSYYVPKIKIGYAPQSYTDTKEILEKAVATLDPQPQIEGATNCRSLEHMMTQHHYLAGVCFHNFYEFDDMNYNDDVPVIQILNFTLLFPSELRVFDNKNYLAGADWKTNIYFDPNNFRQRRNEDNDGGYLGYVREGFIPLQNAISKAYLETINSQNMEIPNIELKRFPFKNYVDDPLNNLLMTVPVLILFGFLIPVITFTYLLTSEKEHQLQQFVKALGVPNFIHFSSWCVVGISLFGANSLILLGTLKLHWSNDFAILSQADPLCLFVLLFAYSLATTTFCVFVSSLFSQSHSSVAVVGILWISTIVPFVADMDDTVGYYLFLNTILSNAFESVHFYEVFDRGLQWGVFFTEDHIAKHTCGNALGILLLHALVYMILAVLIESLSPKLINKSRAWNNLFVTPGKRRNPSLKRLSYLDPLATRVMQVEPLYKKQLVAIENVSKVYKKHEVVRGVNLNLYENDITVLLGHNGAGKTTLLSLIMGVIPASDGRIKIEEYDLEQYSALACSNLGGCLRDHLLYGDLSAENQIKFFSRLKGLSWKQADMEVEKYCRQMQLNDKRKVLTRNLTVGLRHQLAVCCAFAGESKVVILDEPNFGMDLSASKLVLELVLNEKRNRTILISTNSTDIADAIADRVSIMANGSLICSGSIMFLRNMYNKGSRLLITKHEGCKPEYVTKFLQQFIPDINIESQLVKSIVYIIHESYSHLIAEILKSLEKELLTLNIESYSLDDLSINDIVLTMGTDYPHDADNKIATRIMHGETIYSEAAYPSLYLPNEKFVHNKRQECKALFYTRLIYYMRHKWLFLSQLLIPVLYTVIIFTMSDRTPALMTQSKPLAYSLDDYPHSKIIIGEIKYLDQEMARTAYEYKETVFWLNEVHRIDEVNGELFEDITIEILRNDARSFEKYYVIGATFTNDTITGYFNNFPLHSAPLSLNMVYNAVARNLRNKETKISVRIKLLESPHFLSVSMYYSGSKSFYYFVVLLLLAISITLSNSVYDMTKSQSEKFRHWLKIAGAVTTDFWFITFCFDFIKMAIIVTVIILTILICLTVRIISTDVLGVCYFCLLLGGVSINSVHYVNAKLIKHAHPCFRSVLTLAAFGVTLFIIDNEMELQKQFLNKTSKFLLLIHPYYAMGDVLLTVMRIHHYQSLCEHTDIKMLVTGSENLVPRCTNDLDYFDMEAGIMPHIFAFLSVTLLSWFLVILLENITRFRNFWVFRIERDDSECAWADHMKRHATNAPLTVVEDNVTHEEILVYTIKPHEQQSVALIIDRVGKNFGVVDALHRFCFVLDKCQICGILGLNGAGKSVLLKIIANELTQTYGEVRILGANVHENRKEVYRNIGYCPETLDMIQEYTACEILELFAGLNGIQPERLTFLCESLAKLLGFYEYYDRILKICSDGIQKRVGTALALIGNRPILLLDEPLSAIDSAGKLLIYNILARASRSGKSVLFTSLSPTECQKICNKIVIMIDGRLVDTGTLSDLYNRSQYGFMLQVRLKTYHVMDSKRDHHAKESDKRFSFEHSQMRVIALIQKNFEGSTFRHVEGNLLSFVIPIAYDISEVYTTVRNNSFTFNIESIGIARAPLQMIYLNIVDRYKVSNY